MSTKGYPVPQTMMSNEKQHRQQIAQCLQGAMQGKLNATLSVTLTANSTTTTVTDRRIGANTALVFSPATSDAAMAVSGLYVSAQQSGQATLTHASSSSSDRTFNVVLIG